MDFLMNIDEKDLDLAKRIAGEYEEHFKVLKTFVNSLGASAFVKYLADCNLEADTATSLYQYKKIYELSDITDVSVKRTIIDVRTFVNSNALYIPKKHFEQDMTPKYYVYALYDENNEQIIFKGYIATENIDKSQSSNDYYVVYENNLSSMENLIEELYNLNPEEESFNLEDFEGTFAAFCDEELDYTTQLRIIKMLYMSSVSAKSFMNFVKFDMLAQKISDFDEQPQNNELDELTLQKEEAEFTEENFAGNEDNEQNEKAQSDDNQQQSDTQTSIDVIPVVAPIVTPVVSPNIGLPDVSFGDIEDLTSQNDGEEIFDTDNDALSDEIFEENSEDFDLEDNSEDDTESEIPTDEEFITDENSDENLFEEDSESSFENLDDEESIDLTQNDNLDELAETVDEDIFGTDEQDLNEFSADNMQTDINENDLLTTDEDDDIFADNTDENLDFEELQEPTFEGDDQTQEKDEEEFFEDAPTQIFEENIDSDLDNLQEETFDNNELAQEEDEEEFFEDAPTQIFEENIDSDLDNLQEDDELLDITEDAKEPEIVENNDDNIFEKESENNENTEQQTDDSAEYNADAIEDLLNELEQDDKDNANDNQQQSNNSLVEPTVNNSNPELQTLFEEPKQELEIEGENLSESEYSMYVEQPKQKKSKIIVPILSVCVLGSALLAGGTYYKLGHKNAKLDSVSDVKSKNIDDFDDNTFLEKAEMDAMSTNNLASDNLEASPDTMQPKDINQSMTDVFDDTIYPVMISKIAWEVPENYTTSKYFKKYLQVTGVQLQRELQQNLSKVAELSTTGKIKVSFQLYSDNSVKNLKVVETSGSGEIDNITLKSVKNTLSYVKVPVIPSSDNFVTLSMVINF